MVVKSQIKLIKSLYQKKYRTVHGLFVVEGLKMVSELLETDFEPYAIYVVNPDVLGNSKMAVEAVSSAELVKMSSLKSPNEALGVFRIPEPKPLDFSKWIVALDTVQDPGNLGTIIRLCDWFGIPQLLCAPGTADCYNPKVLQATMGSIGRVNVVYADLAETFKSSGLPVYGTFMNAESAYSEAWPEAGILLMGNEGKGISPALEPFIHKRVGIPQFGGQRTESLNVATATAILLNEIRRG